MQSQDVVDVLMSRPRPKRPASIEVNKLRQSTHVNDGTVDFSCAKMDWLGRFSLRQPYFFFLSAVAANTPSCKSFGRLDECECLPSLSCPLVSSDVQHAFLFGSGNFVPR